MAVRNAASSDSQTSPAIIAAKKPSASSSLGVAPSNALSRIDFLTDGDADFLSRRPVAISMKFASCLAPCGVPTDSGWYWTPSIG